jgi:hypothetical protein
MTYLVRYTDTTKTFPQPGDINEVDRWEIIDEVCQGNSLRDINPYLVKNKLPMINNLTNLIIDGIILVYSVNVTEQLYLLDSEHDKCVQIMRDYKLENILHNG